MNVKNSVCFVLALLGVMIFISCDDGSQKLEKNAVIQSVTISPEEAREGIVKIVRAPDGEFYSMKIPAGTPNGKLLLLPPKIAEKYHYPLYFKINVLEGGSEPADDLLHRKKENLHRQR